MMTQREVIRQHLQEHGHITQREADMEYGVSRLSARIWELKRQGMKIETTMIPVLTRRGSTMVAAYRMVE